MTLLPCLPDHRRPHVGACGDGGAASAASARPYRHLVVLMRRWATAISGGLAVDVTVWYPGVPGWRRLALGERPAGIAVVGIVLAFVAVVLVAAERVMTVAAKRN